MHENGVAEAVEEAASEQLGVERRDRPAIFAEVAAASVDAGLPYWAVLALSGGIATLGLALDSSAIVIGAMLVAPLLAPVIGLSLALAIGDGRLAVQSGLVVLASTLLVALVAALVTLALPFPTMTEEVLARARPTVLDLGVAIFSGLVGALVTVARGSRLSAAIPGVAVAVALIPPLAVAGFALGAGLHPDIVGGSLLLFGANLAGIVLSGVIVFLLVGMHRAEVLRAARAWHRSAEPTGLARWIVRPRWARSLGVFGSPWKRAVLSLGFVAVLAIPLTEGLRQITREARVRGAVEAAAQRFAVPGRASILGRDLAFGRYRTRVYLRVATTSWFGEEARRAFEAEASRRAEEPVTLVLEQLPATVGDLRALADLMPSGDAPAQADAAPGVPTGDVAQLMELARSRALAAAAGLRFPEGAGAAGLRLTVGDSARPEARLAYVAPEPLQPQAAQILAAELRDALALPGLRVAFVHLSPLSVPLAGAAAGARADSLAALLRTHPLLGLDLLVGPQSDSASVQAALAALRQAGVAEPRVRLGAAEDGDLRVRLRPLAPRLGG